MAMHHTRHANAHWEGTLKEGGGSLKLGSGVYEGPYTWAGRFSDGPGTNPEELIGAAHSGCYTMFLSSILTNNGYNPTRIDTEAAVHLEDGPTITKIELDVEAEVDGLDEESFQKFAQEAKEKCPVSKALAAVPEIILNATLVS
ncbi:MAG: OsmC family protein [Candidatus Promineifilaceae bacterium]|jgi:lipoyl-dependent peroxiredoxin